jgi:hypothetical protein
MRGRLVDLFTFALIALAVTSASEASLLTYDFSVTGVTGPDTGVTARGSFTINSDIVVDGGQAEGSDLLSALNFTWDGTTYSAQTMNTGGLDWDANGKLTLVIFGNHCETAACLLTGPGFVTYAYGSPMPFVYNIGDSEYLGSATAPVLVSSPVPEPATLGLACFAFVSLGFIRRKKYLRPGAHGIRMDFFA